MKEEKEVVARFFAALERLAADGCIRGLKTFADRYHTNRGNMSVMRSTLSGIHVEWLTFLVRDYMVSPLWLLTGEGVFYREGWDAEMVKKFLPDKITTYFARHSWATIAAELDIPDDVISQALGHAARNSTTAIYIERNIRKVDEANRKVIDWVLYDKR